MLERRQPCKPSNPYVRHTGGFNLLMEAGSKRTMRGKIKIFSDGNNLFHAARSVGIEIDYAKFLNFLRNDSPLLRAFFYTGVDEKAERQQGFLLWMRRNG